MSTMGTVQLQSVNEKGWRRGLDNLLAGEYSAWFKSSRWWKQLLIWFTAINGLMVILVIEATKAARRGEEGPPVFFLYGIFGGLMVAFGVMIVMQRVLVREKNSGTAAWVLSKPVTRTAFVVSRLVVNSIAILLTSVIVPGVIFYITMGLFGASGWPSLLRFTAGLGLYILHAFFWITLVLMLGTLTNSSSVVIAVPVALCFILWMGPLLIPGLVYISPLQLPFSAAPDQASPLFVSFMTGEPVFSWVPLIATVVSCVVFIAVAIQRFNRQEF